jgi:hypothetical protein
MGQEYGKSDILKIVYCEFCVSDFNKKKLLVNRIVKFREK